MTNKEIMKVIQDAMEIIAEEWPKEHWKYRVVPRLKQAAEELERRPV